jgi:hypothetical protein
LGKRAGLAKQRQANPAISALGTGLFKEGSSSFLKKNQKTFAN